MIDQSFQDPYLFRRILPLLISLQASESGNRQLAQGATTHATMAIDYRQSGVLGALSEGMARIRMRLIKSPIT